MRLDVFLKISGLAKNRTFAKALCDKNKVLINETSAKASKEVHEGDILFIDYGAKKIKIRVKKIPEKKSVSRKERRELYEIMEVERIWF